MATAAVIIAGLSLVGSVGAAVVGRKDAKKAREATADASQNQIEQQKKLTEEREAKEKAAQSAATKGAFSRAASRRKTGSGTLPGAVPRPTVGGATQAGGKTLIGS